MRHMIDAEPAVKIIRPTNSQLQEDGTLYVEGNIRLRLGETVSLEGARWYCTMATLDGVRAWLRPVPPT